MNGSRKTAVVVDTTAYMPPELMTQRGIESVSLYVTVDDELVPEREVGDYAEFFEKLRASGGGATTSQPSIGDFCTVYEPLLEAGQEIVSIHLSAGISGTYETAMQARNKLSAEGADGDKIHVYDSRSAAGGMAMLAMTAINTADEGADGASVMESVATARDGLKMWFAIDTLEYLRRSGRLGAARALIGSTLKIKPILTMEEEITPVDRVRTRARVAERMREYAQQRSDDGATMWCVQHIQDPETAEALAADCREIFGFPEVFVGEIGPVLGAHTGPGLIGVGAIAPVPS